MRVSTAQIFDTGTFGIQSNQASLFKIQNQLSTGRRILTPADDPVGAAQALVVTQSKEVNAQYLDNQAAAKTQLSLVESNLGSISDEIQNVLEKAIAGGNGALAPDQRNMIATELKSRLDNLISLANSQDGTGKYLYSGYQSQQRPFELTGNVAAGVPPAFDLANTSVAYRGDDGQRALQVDASQEMVINVAGSEAFMQVRDSAGNLTGRSIFDSVQNLINNLQQPAFSPTALSQEIGDLNAALDNISRVRATVGTRLNALEGLTSAGGDRDLQYEQRISDLQDIDYAKAISDLSRHQLQLEAAQKSFAQTSQLTLFNVL